jgi:hypothetical protein
MSLHSFYSHCPLRTGTRRNHAPGRIEGSAGASQSQVNRFPNLHLVASAPQVWAELALAPEEPRGRQVVWESGPVQAQVKPAGMLRSRRFAGRRSQRTRERRECATCRGSQLA